MIRFKRAGLIALAGMLAVASVLVATAGSTSLDGGGGCFGTGRTTASGGLVSADTFAAGSPCNSFTDAYLQATTPPGYADLAGSWGTLAIYWGTAAPSVQATHNLCHTWCNGYVDTSAP